MGMTGFPTFKRTTVAAVGAALVLALAGCGSAQDVSRFFTDPGKYDVYSCPQIGDQMLAIEKEGQRLQEMMAKADRGAGGPIINGIAYEPDYVANRAEMRELKKSAAAKKCPPPRPPPPTSRELIR